MEVYSSRSSLGPVDLAFTDRLGGVSAVPFDSLDLALAGDGTGEEAAALAENHRRVLDDFAPGCHLADMSQVHGADVVVVRESGGPRPSCDALVTTRTDVVVMVRAADCVPVLLADPEAGVVAAAHAGRPGVAHGVVAAVVARMREVGAEEVSAWIGPHVCGACYEVPEDLQRQIVAIEPATLATTRWGTPSLDLGAGVRAQLETQGVRVQDLSRCTRESPDLFSYRRDGARAGRIAGLLRRRPTGVAPS